MGEESEKEQIFVKLHHFAKYTWNEHTVNQQYRKFFKKVNSSTGDS